MYCIEDLQPKFLDLANLSNTKKYYSPYLLKMADPDMIKWKQLFVKKSWPLGTTKLDKNCLLHLMSNFFLEMVLSGLGWMIWKGNVLLCTSHSNLAKGQCVKLLANNFLAMILLAKLILGLVTPILAWNEIRYQIAHWLICTMSG